jgi:exosortase E/protease (VPEID-CTERM system)
LTGNHTAAVRALLSSESGQGLVRRAARNPLVRRGFGLAVLLATELLVATVAVDGGRGPQRRGGLIQPVRNAAPFVASSLVCFVTLFAAFAALRYPAAMAGLARRASDTPLRRGWLAGHVASAAVFFLCLRGVFANGSPWAAAGLLAIAWTASAAVLIACAALAFLPANAWLALRKSTGRLWMWCAAAALIACSFASVAQSLWRPASRVTFTLVQAVLRPIVPDLVIQPERLRLFTPRFGVIITEGCSGLEGLLLLAVFSLLWLILFRDELRLARALVLLPFAGATLYGVNVLRIAALFLIGDAGARSVAVGGFHSQAGWIAFCAVSTCLVVGARRLSWVARARVEATVPVGENPVAPYLLPFLAIVAAGMISGALSGGFEWLYGLRVLAAAATAFAFRHAYRRIDWRAGSFSIAAGALVAALWIAAAGPQPTAMPGPLAAAAVPVRVAWIALRILGAVATVPIAEELAFRGFLLRRFASPDFEDQPFRTVSWPALAASSVLFGVMHGRFWHVAIVAGFVFGLCARWNGRLGEAIAAHAVSNALLVCYVLYSGDWRVW